jgi:small subunit ribosomal protein S1
MSDATDDVPAGDEEDFGALLADSEAAAAGAKRFAPGDLVRGRVVSVGQDAAFVAIGGKSEAVIDLGEFRDPETGEVRLRAGDQIEATVTDDGSRSGSIVLKHTLGRGGHVPGELEQALAHGIAVEGVVTGQNKGGFDVQIAGHQAFCPASQIDVRRGEPGQYIGERLRFRIRKIEAGGRNIVVSRRELLEEETAAQAARTWKQLRVDAVMRGTVSSIRDFGAFVDLGGVEGLIHVSELGHGRVEHPSEVLQVGQAVEVMVVRIEPASEGGRTKVALSLRALAPDPWATAAERFPVGATVRGTVRRLERFGAFVELEPGIDGLVHVSRMALGRRVVHPRDVVAIGDEIEVSVISLDVKERRIGLSLVEAAQQEAAAQEREAMAAVQASEPQSLGTLGDLLARSTKRKE